MLPKKRKPTHPGVILLEEYLEPLGVSQRQFALHLGKGWTPPKLNEIINGKRGISVDSALDLAAALRTTSEFWLNLQINYELWEAMRRRPRRRIEPIEMVI